MRPGCAAATVSGSLVADVGGPRDKVHAAAVLARAGFARPVRPDRLARMGLALLTWGVSPAGRVPRGRGFVEATITLSKIGSDVLFLSTGLAAPEIADVLRRESVIVAVTGSALPGPLATRGSRVPRVVVVHDDLPRNATGKALKRDLASGYQ